MMLLSRLPVTMVPSSHKSHRLYAVDRSSVEQYNPSTLSKASTRIGEATVLSLDMTKERIRKLFNNVDYSVSAYDTAWIAMVPSPNSLISPCFPNCLKWLMDNQHKDGSWGMSHDNSLLKDNLSSTLAGIIALRRWNVGEDQINKGLYFINSNCAAATNMDQPSPFGFEIIFPHMLRCAKDLNINLPFKEIDLSLMLNRRELELRRCLSEDMEAYLAYISEGLGDLYDHNMVMKYQMKNGSILNSPSATSSVLIRHQSVGCMNYLSELLEKFGNGVPTLYPLGLYVRLCMVDALKRLGITRHFRMEIQNVLDETYRCWVQNDEQIFMDVATCALAFRVLRTNGYEVSSDPLAEVTEMGASVNSHKETFKGVYAALEVYRATHVIHEDEDEDVSAFEDIKLRSKKYLEKIISTTTVPSNKRSKLIHDEVDNALKFPINGCLDRISTRRNIENYNVDNTRIWKTAYSSSNIANEGYLRLAVEDFNTTQSIYRAEVQGLERWMEENRLNDLEFARQNSAYCYFSVAATLYSPELSDARICWAKNSILVTIVDDFFDVGGSMDEFENLIQCVERWDVNLYTDCISNEVRILYLAIKDIVCWTRDAAFQRQGRDVKSHVIEIWLRMLKNMQKEAIWVTSACVPTINEYMENGYVTIGIGPTLLPALYFVGPSLSEEIVRSSEYEKLFELVSTQGRLLNDIRTFKRELEVGKLNVVPLHMIHGKTRITEEEVVNDIKMLIEKKRRELMKLVMEGEGSSIVPRACKDAFWDMSNVLNLFYATDDGFTGRAILDVVKDVIYKPVTH